MTSNNDISTQDINGEDKSPGGNGMFTKFISFGPALSAHNALSCVTSTKPGPIDGSWWCAFGLAVSSTNFLEISFVRASRMDDIREIIYAVPVLGHHTTNSGLSTVGYTSISIPK